MINRHSRVTWPWANLPKQHERATRLCIETVAEPVKLTWACDTPVPSNLGRTCQNNTGVDLHTLAWEKRAKTDMAILRARPLGVGHCIDWTALEQVQLADDVRALLTTDPWDLFFAIIEPTYLELTLELCLTFHVQDVMTNFDDPRIVQSRLGGLVRQLSVPEFGIALGLYTKEFRDKNDLNTLHHHIHYSPSKCRDALVPGSATYDPSHSKASALSPSLRYLHAILAHTLTGRRESTSIINTHDTYFLWSMANGHVFDLTYFIALVICHQTERH
ncbi:hypothetical protein PVK06_026841 [Gossypium arboreum]|uniref:Uncharacterized protein n=1 Tax=Gossypium arboreum TaxID=29729 RepID=A0ABR0NZ26_GOSAR|nr:hypothetical protein PVK06_026841 [Gossypium arboreum]